MQPILSPVKKSSAAETAKANLDLVHTTRAFEHGHQAFGAQYIQSGFARSPEYDLLFALGWPHARYLIDGHSDDALTDPVAIEKAVFKTQVGLGVPREIALRRIRAFAAYALGPDGKLRQGAVRALLNRDPMNEEEAQKFVAEHLAGRSLGTKQLEIIFLLEAFMGPDAIAEAITRAFEVATDVQLLDHAAEKSLWAFGLGFLLLRVEATRSAALRERLRAVIRRCPKEGVNSHSVANVLDQVLHQTKASLRSDHTDQSLLLHFIDETPSAVREQLAANARPFGGALYARMVFLGGEDVIDYYKKHFDKVKEAAEKKAIVAQFGRIASPKIRELMEGIAEKANGDSDAQAWLDENRSYR
jgi:hypothetical protein